MENLLKRLASDYPAIQFVPGDSFYWSAATNQISYNTKASVVEGWSILHELAHALLCHLSYTHDFELLQLEVSAWEKAKELGLQYAITINPDHIEDCLDSYRDWLYKRSICPSCGARSVQQDDASQYQCFNCYSVWRVTPSRFCRPYRQSDEHQKNRLRLFPSQTIL